MLSLARTTLQRTTQLAHPSPLAAFRFPTSVARMSTTAEKHNPWAQALPRPAEELNTYLANLPDFTQDSKRCRRRPASLSAKVAACTRHARLMEAPGICTG